jgi:threonine 3-dehydrogenase
MTIPATMRVPRFARQGRIEWDEKPVPQPQAGQLLLQVRANALCGSERGQFHGGSRVTPGHEAAGVVVASGPQTSTRTGAQGVVFLMDFCAECRSCRLGFTNQCLQKCADMGFNRDGGYGVYELVSENIFFAVDDDLSPTDATLLLDVMGTGGHAIKRAQQIRPDIESLLVCGAGPIGLGVLAMAKLLMGDDFPVFITDANASRLKLAQKLGGKTILLPDATLSQPNEEARPRGKSVVEGLNDYSVPNVDIAIDTSGKIAARQSAMEVLAQRGVLVCVGHGEGLQLDVSSQMIAPERAVLGSEYFQFDELPDNLQLLRANRDYLQQIIAHRAPIGELQSAFEMFFAGAAGKTVIEQ